ncbi:MAG: helix-turn-helix transcriptional regulator [Leucobacter sp.]
MEANWNGLTIGLARELLQQFDLRGYLVLSGENGVGKSHVLTALGHLLTERKTLVALVSCADRTSAFRVLRESDPSVVLLIDDLETADLELLRAISIWTERGGKTISALESSNATTSYTREIDSLLAESSAADSAAANAYRYRVNPMTVAETQRFIHANSPTTLTTYAAEVLSELSWGRPAWALDLITLDQAGYVSIGPAPRINTHQLQELHLPGMKSAATAIGAIDAEVAAAAIALSEIDPLNPSQAEYLTNGEVVRALTDRGILLPQEDDDTSSVPIFLAAALEPWSTPDTLADARFGVASRLIQQESLGLPLSITDSLFCARVLSHVDNTGSAPHQPLLNLLLRTSDETIDFVSHGNSRALLLRLANHGVQLTGLLGARAMTLLAGSQQGLSRLDTSPAPDTSAENIGETFLRAILDAQSTASISIGASPGFTDLISTAESGTTESASERIARLWNTAAPLTGELKFLRAAMNSEEHEAIQLAAAALCMHELLWRGYSLTDADHARFLHLMQLVMRASNNAYRDIIGTAFITYACKMLVSDNFLARAQELQRVVSEDRSAPFHRQWLTHLIGAAGALSLGHAQRAALEWKHFTQSTPRFLPARLRAHLTWFSEAIENATKRSPVINPTTWWPAADTKSAPRQDEWTIAHIVDYVIGEQEQAPPPPTTEIDAPRVPVISLMYQHLAASKAQNPAELQRVAAKLFELRLGGPALSALTEARSILVKRRSTGAVARCDQQIQLIESELLERYAWLRETDLPRVEKSSLTARETEAARLAAQGLSNADIAEKLNRSVRTIESHLSQARAKLGATSRREFILHPALVSGRR